MIVPRMLFFVNDIDIKQGQCIMTRLDYETPKQLLFDVKSVILAVLCIGQIC